MRSRVLKRFEIRDTEKVIEGDSWMDIAIPLGYATEEQR